ncbi:MAG: thioredoxin family protein [Odoribacteraceae bacterium]|jgi:thiol:disulfide interchange protein DsbD|nr:thioredoxin family protein [Odoribacteraceae bacterium]
MKRKIFVSIVMLCLVTLPGLAQMMNPTRWSSSIEKAGEDTYTITLKASIDPGWVIYSLDTPDGGPQKAEWTIDEAGTGQVELLGAPVEKEPKRKFDDIFKVDVLYFAGKYEVSRQVKVTDPGLSTIHATMTFQACEEQCVNLTEEFAFAIEPRVAVAPATSPASEAAAKDDNLWLFFWLAFGSGLLAVVMPCVFPMIPMTVSFFMHGDANKAKARSKALFFSFSIIAIYTALGLLVSFLLGPGFINWLSTHWLPNTFFFVIFILFAASFFGAFEIVLPAWLVNKSDKQADKGGYAGAFFMAFTLVLVSFSCTAPIVGTVLVEAARGSILRPIIGMLGFSIAVALPFGFFAFFPSRLGALPKSGGWLNTVKVVLGFIEVALGFKFLMVADQTYHWGLLDREVYIALWIVIFLLMGIYLMGKIKFRHDSDLSHIGVGRLTLIIVTFTFVVYLIPGMFGAPLKALSGYLPPQESIDFDINRIVRENVKGITAASAPVTPGIAGEKVKYAEFLHLPHGLDGYFEYEQALRAARAADKPLFIDFTGHGCANCREMESAVWSDPRVLEVLRRDFVVLALYVDDKTKLPEADHYVSEYDGKKKNTLGKKNTDFQVKKFNSNAQPNYILLDSRHGDEVDLVPHLLAPPRGHDLNRDAFLAFLQQGVKEYKARAGR